MFLVHSVDFMIWLLIVTCLLLQRLCNGRMVNHKERTNNCLLARVVVLHMKLAVKFKKISKANIILRYNDKPIRKTNAAAYNQMKQGFQITYGV